MSEPQTLLFRMTIEQANYILELLGQQPYVRVHGLIAQMQAQAKEQLQPDPGEQVLGALAGMGGPPEASAAEDKVGVIDHAG